MFNMFMFNTYGQIIIVVSTDMQWVNIYTVNENGGIFHPRVDKHNISTITWHKVESCVVKVGYSTPLRHIPPYDLQPVWLSQCVSLIRLLN